MPSEPKGPPVASESWIETKKDDGKSDAVGILQLIASLVGSLAWPLVILYLATMLSGPIGRLIDRSNSITAKVPGGEFSVAQVAASAAAVGAAAGAAAADSSKGNTLTQQEVQKISKQAVKNISDIFGARSDNLRPLNQGKILWVDDTPTNNTLLVRSFQDLDIQVTQATSTDQAKDLLQKNSYDIVISDMGRPPDNEAGITLLKWMQERQLKTPVVIYAGSWAAANVGREKDIGALQITNDPSVVYHLALRVIQGDLASSTADTSSTPAGMQDK
jgi:CheY-like chemotaxis protein